MATILQPYNPQLDPLAIFTSGLTNLADQRLLGKELQQLQGLAPGSPMPSFQSPQLQQMQAQGMMQSLMPLGPRERVALEAEKARLAYWKQRPQTQQYSSAKVAKAGDSSGLEPGTVYQASPTGNIDVLERPDPNARPEKQLAFWQNVRRVAKGTDPGSQTSRALAMALGQDVVVTEDAETVKLADKKIEELRKVLGIKTPIPKARDRTQQPSSAGTQVLKAPPPSKVAGEKRVNAVVDKRIQSEVMAKIRDPRGRLKVYIEAAKLKSIWGELTDEEKVSAYKKLAEGWTGDEVVAAFKNAR
jgi:hypothetical protein